MTPAEKGSPMQHKEELMNRLHNVDDAIEWKETVVESDGQETSAIGRMVRIDPGRYGQWASGYMAAFVRGYECAETGEMITGVGSMIFLEEDPAAESLPEAGDSLALMLGASNWVYSDHVPPMQPGDMDLGVDDLGHYVTVALLEEGLAARTVSTEAGEVLSVDVADVPEGFGEVRFPFQ